MANKFIILVFLKETFFIKKQEYGRTTQILDQIKINRTKAKE